MAESLLIILFFCEFTQIFYAYNRHANLLLRESKKFHQLNKLQVSESLSKDAKVGVSESSLVTEGKGFLILHPDEPLLSFCFPWTAHLCWLKKKKKKKSKKNIKFSFLLLFLPSRLSGPKRQSHFLKLLEVKWSVWWEDESVWELHICIKDPKKHVWTNIWCLQTTLDFIIIAKENVCISFKYFSIDFCTHHFCFYLWATNCVVAIII